MSRILALLAALAPGVAAFATDSSAQTPAPDAFIRWARTHAVEFPSHDSAGAAAVAKAGAVSTEPSWLRSVIGEARVVALGEPAHGAQEPLAFRNRLFERLVEDCGFTAIALESGLSESRKLDEYVLGGPGEAAEVARQAFTWGFGTYPENVQLLQWIRQYNADPAHHRKLHVYGIDLSGGDEGQFVGARVALDDALEYLARFAPALHRRVLQPLRPFLTRLNRASYLELTEEERLRFTALLRHLVAAFDSSRARLIASATRDSYEWARQEAVNAAQVESLLRLWPAGTSADAVSPDFHDAAVSRDASMAANVRWVLEREGPSGRILVFAHNAHVLNAPLRGGIWSVYRHAPTVMGQRLRAELGSRDYVIIASTANPKVQSEQIRSPTLDAALTEVSRGLLHPFVLDLRDPTRSQEMRTWLESPQTLRANFTTEIEITPATALDAVAFLGEAEQTTTQAAVAPAKRIIAGLSDVSIEELDYPNGGNFESAQVPLAEVARAHLPR